MKLKRKIQIVGCPGTGKSTLGKQLCARLGFRRIELDAIHWQPGWTECPRDEFRARVQNELQGDGWIVDGNYQTALGDTVQADTVIWLDLARSIVMRRVTERTLRRAFSKEPLWNGNREPLTNFYRWDIEQNIIRWAWVKHPEYRRRYEERTHKEWKERQVIRLRTPGEVKMFARSCWV